MKTNKNWFWIFSYVLIDLVCVAIGMGVPLFNILLGFFVGWFLVRKISARETEIGLVLRKTFLFALLTSVFTFLIMLVIWGRTIVLLFDPTFNLANFGIPQVLFTPVASFIGWLVLMIFISPFLQLLTTIFSAYLTLLVKLNKS